MLFPIIVINLIRPIKASGSDEARIWNPLATSYMDEKPSRYNYRELTEEEKLEVRKRKEIDSLARSVRGRLEDDEKFGGR